MKKIILFAAVFALFSVFAAPQLQLFPAQRNKSPIIGGAVVERPDATVLLFKLKPETPENFKLNNLYIHLDDNIATGRKKIGNEYYCDPAKGQLSSYSADGVGKLHRRAVTAHRVADWYYLIIANENLIHGKISAARFIINSSSGSGVVTLKAPPAPVSVDAPQIPAVGARRIMPPPPVKKTPAAPVKADGSKKKISSESRYTISDFFPEKVPQKYGDIEIFIANGDKDIQTADDTTGAKTVVIDAARNSIEDFQIGVWIGKRARGGIYLDWGKLTDASGKVLKNGKITMSRVLGTQFFEPVNPKFKYALGGFGKGPFIRKEVLDRCVPYRAGGKTGGYKSTLTKTFTLFRGSVHLPVDTAPGIYTLELNVTHPHGKEKLTLKVNVDKFALPERPSFVMFADLPRLINYRSGIPGVADDMRYPNGMTLNLAKCLQSLRDHRIAPRRVNVETPIRFNAKGEPEIDFSSFDALMKYTLDELKMNPRLEMPLATVSSGHGNWYTSLYGDIGYSHISDEFRKNYVNTLRAVLKHLRSKGWEKFFFAYYSDEPARDQTAQTIELAKLIRSADKSLVPWIYGPGPTEQYIDVIDTWMGGFGSPLEAGEAQMPEQSRALEIARKRGDRLGVYNPHTSYLLNVPPAYTRSLYHWAYQQDLYWMSMYCLAYFTTGPQDLTNRRYWHYWVYPPEPGKSDIWENSVRYEATRTGLNDYEYLFAIQEKVEALKKVIPALKNLSKRAVALEYANATVHSREVRSGDWELLQKVRRAMSQELRNLNSSVPAVIHCQWDNGSPVLEIYAVDGSVITFAGKEYIANGSAVTISLPQDAAGRTVEVQVKHNGKSAILTKYLLPPLGQDR